MGHLGHLKEEYRALARRLEAGPVALPEPDDERAWRAWREILEILYAPEEAELASRLPVLPATLEQIARRLGRSAEELRPRLERMCDKGLVLDVVSPSRGTTRYLLSPPVVGFFEFSMMRAGDDLPRRRLAQALDAYCHGDETFVKEVFGAETVVGRALVHETALAEETPDCLDWERATAVVEQARTRAVSLCYCRHKAEHLGHACGYALESCLSLDGGADFVVRRGFGRAIGREEALDVLAKAREAGLVQIADNVMRRPAYLCNCCACCCEQLRAASEFGIRSVNPSGFQPQVASERCKGCSRCARACPVLAIEMKGERQASRPVNTLVPALDLERCIGCGLCVDACRQNAMTMARRERPTRVPENALERVVRMALERNRLAKLVDENAGRGAWFLSRMLGALTRLPAVERALASEQLQSRFVRFALGTARDPSV